jgi:hypothetical protein
MSAGSNCGLHAGAFKKPASDKTIAAENAGLVSIINYARTPVYSTAGHSFQCSEA